MAITKLSNSGIKTQTNLKYDSMLAGNPAYYPVSYESIATVTVGAGGTSSISFTSIPSTYTHLQIRTLALCSSNDLTGAVMRFNSDTGNNYSAHWLRGNGSATSSGNSVSIDYVVANFGASNTFPTPSVIDILDYANTNKNKTTRTNTGADLNGSGNVWFFSGLWTNTNAITSITIAPNSGNFNQYSSFALYGIKNV
jgi:hypothetical protein